MTYTPEPAVLFETIRSDTALAAAAARLGTDVAVPTCPGWSLHDLSSHLGHVQRWAAAVQTSEPDAIPDFGTDPAPETAEGIAEWLETGALHLIGQLSSVDPARPVFTFEGPGVPAFWFRRMAHEASIHRWDAEDAHEVTSEIDVPMSTDGIDEFLDIQAPRRVTEGAFPEARSIQLTANDHDLGEHPGVWHIGVGPDGMSWSHQESPADATLALSVEGLLLAVHGRVDADDLEIDGDRSLFTQWRAAVAG